MTKRPDIFDRSTPSSGWRWWRSLRPLFWRDLLLIVEVLRGVITPKLDLILKELKKMSAREDAADARTVELIELVRQHNADKDAKIAELQAALASADADKAAALESASDEDAGRQEAFNSALDELAGNAAPPADEPAPAPE